MGVSFDFEDVAAGDHGSHAVEEPDHNHQGDVDQNKQDDQIGADEMQAAGRLPTAEHRHQPGLTRIHRRRHGQAGQDHQGQDAEDHGQIGEFLDGVIASGFLALGEAQAGVVQDLVPEVLGRQLIRRRQKVALDMAVQQVGDHIEDAIEDEEPGEEEVPVTAIDQGAIAGNGRP